MRMRGVMRTKAMNNLVVGINLDNEVFTEMRENFIEINLYDFPFIVVKYSIDDDKETEEWWVDNWQIDSVLGCRDSLLCRLLEEMAFEADIGQIILDHEWEQVAVEGRIENSKPPVPSLRLSLAKAP